MLARGLSRFLLVLLIAVGAWGRLEADTAADSRLMTAVKAGDKTAVSVLLRQRVNVNAAEADGTTALHWAVLADDLGIARSLIRAGANVTAANRHGVTPLALAATNGNAALIEALLESGAKPDAALPEGETVLMTAARTGKVAAVQVLLAAGADVNATEAWRGETALMWAASQNHAEVAKLLIRHGADIDARSIALKFPEVRYNLATHATLPPPQGGFTALMFAARQGALETARVLTEARADVNRQDPDGTSALMVAIVNTHYDVARLLIEKGADPDIADIAGMTALYAAVDLHTMEMYPARKPPRKSTSRSGSLDVVKMLLASGANPNPRLKTVTLRWGRRRGPGDGALAEGSTPLMRAARFGDVAAMRLLLDAGADPSLKQKDQTTALMLAAGVGWRTGETILGGTDYGPETDAIEAVTLCLERGADVNAANEDGETALHGAVVRGPGVIRVLADHGARLDAKDKRGRTPLDVALGVGAERQRVRVSPVRETTAALLRQLTSAATVDNSARPQ